MLVACAWCDRLSSDGEAWIRPTPWRFLVRPGEPDAGLTHGICPGCFAKLAPEVAYPVRLA